MALVHATRETDVVIVGAGPTGLMLALCLTRLGVRVEILDRKHGPTRESRALVLQARTMELYDQLGIVDRVIAEATTVAAAVPGFGRRRFGRVDLARLATGVTPYPRLYVFEQSRNERLLVDALEAEAVPVRWGCTLESVDAIASDRVEVCCAAGSSEPVQISARYCVGADGSSSRVRELAGIPFEGTTNPHTFYVLDADGVSGIALDSVNVRFGEHEFLLSFPMGSVDHERLLGVVRTPAGEPVAESHARAVMERAFGIRYESSKWFSTYRVHHRVAARFRAGPVFLAGDAAHVHSPVGAQGMNTGLQDAHNLACKIGDVIAGRADDASLERYEAERRPVAMRLVSTTDSVFGLITSERAPGSAIRRWLLPVAGPVAAFALPRLVASSKLFEYLSQTRIHYWMSDAARRDAHGRRGDVVGRRLPFTGDNHASLRTMQWQVHGYGAGAERVARSLDLPWQDFGASGHPRLSDSMLYLVRPDGFVAAVASRDAAAAAFAAALPAAGRSTLSRGHTA